MERTRMLRFHFDTDGESIEKAPLQTYLGRATVVDLAQAFLDSKEKHLITIEDLRPSAEAIAATSRLLVKTGRWSDSTVFPDKIPVIAADVPAWLQKNGVRLLGLDLPSVDEIDSKSLQNHHALARAGVAIIESLDLSNVASGDLSVRGVASKNRRRRRRTDARSSLARVKPSEHCPR